MNASQRIAAAARGWVPGRSRSAASGADLAFGRRFAAAFAIEWEERRFFLWSPVLAGTGVLLFLAADRDPVLAYAWALTLACAILAFALRRRRTGFMLAVAAALVLGGFSGAGWRAARVGGAMLDRIRIAKLSGVVEQVDRRREGSRFILSVGGADLAPRPDRVRLTTRRDEPIAAGDAVTLTARLLPPAQASLPGGYGFARDAYFAGIGAVGSVLGRVQAAPPGPRPSWIASLRASIDRTRNRLADRIDGVLGGDTGAIAAAMVTGKRDLLSEDARTVIREAGIFHIITIAGVQMTLVAGLLFGGTRRLLALSPALALHHPIKKWAAATAIAGALGYDVLTGSRVGTERALIMTLIMLGAVLVDRRGFTMRNLALSALAVILCEPEAITGASFQLSFAAVAALVAVYEARERRREAGEPGGRASVPAVPSGRLSRLLGHGRDLLVATFCATLATASFMAANFHELSPYVLVGNPLTLAVIEFFAVPGALLGTALYPLGLDGPVWSWVGLGIRLVLWAARLIGSAPGSTVNLPAFAPWALPFLALAVLSAVIWRTPLFRATAVPLALVGLAGTALGPSYDVIVAGDGAAVAVRGPDRRLHVVGRASDFTAEQWLRADADGRDPAVRPDGAVFGRCDPAACVTPLPGDQTLSLVSDPRAFEEDCDRADVVVTPLYAPASCAAPLVIDRGTLQSSGALGLSLRNGGWVPDATRGPTQDRPWSPRPPPPRFRPPRRRPALADPAFPDNPDAATP